ncbi:MAG: OsmC family peroxiredoxin [Candidatus Competibacteraceae bacterium]|nr:OsmC family peroxiredoxin [Candidatus Competibacteraceae bacterium]
MNKHNVTVIWQRSTADFEYKTFDRTHTWLFPGGQSVQGSSAPAYFGKPELTNPEEGLIASLSSCQMLTFLSIAALQGYTVECYQDDATGELGKNARGKTMIKKIILRPKVTFSGALIPDAESLAQLHNKAKENCFVSNSLLTEVVLEAN